MGDGKQFLEEGGRRRVYYLCPDDFPTIFPLLIKKIV